MSARRADGPACRRCGHARDDHPPVPGGVKAAWCRADTDLGTCPCWQWLPVHPWSQLLAWMRRKPAPVEPYVLYPRPVRYPVPGQSEDDDDRTLLGFRPPLYVPRPRGGWGVPR